MEAQEISVQSKPPKSYKFGYRIDRTFGKVTGMVVDKDGNLILADKSFLRITIRMTIPTGINVVVYPRNTSTII
jgi:hypothetical protein